MATSASTSGEWLKGGLQELRGRTGSALELDDGLISGLVSFCELAPPPDAADYLANIVGAEAAQDLIQEYLQRRGYIDPSKGAGSSQSSNLQPYLKPSADAATAQTKKQTRTQKDPASSSSQSSKIQSDAAETHAASKRGPKKKGGKAISLAEAAKGSIVFKQGKPCSCQARLHNLVSNCLSCGKIVCEQEGEGPCSFCGSLVLMEGSTYAGLSDVGVPLSDTEVAAEAYAKRLVDYDRNSAARTKVYDDQSDYFEMEGNSWLSSKEKTNLKKVHDEAQDAAEKQKGKVTVTFDLVGRKVILNKDEAAESESDQGIMRPLEQKHQVQRIQPSPSIREQPVFVETGPVKPRTDRVKQSKKLGKNGLCLEVTGRVQHDDKDPQSFLGGKMKKGDHLAYSSFGQVREGDDYECSLDFD
ncbi:activating signal cointegrator 1-like [Triticum dicoccoides]|uniref:activating signal cointegrator 1-like n=1 Tax=Triticum dicoccoides TaxID=85692 RepID=UPI00188FC8F8|nr:activating signal cointegrator 1-like [Triticum dicoccoides]